MIDLTKIENPKFLRDLSIKELEELASSIREFLIENVSKTGGHLSSNLGVVELTIALHYVFNDELDKFLFDVGHQTYVHKILTGRAKDFGTLRQYKGLSGYSDYKESKYDAWESGHSSNSISAMSGFMLAKDKGAPIGKTISVIGDASIANGMAFEALNFLGNYKNKNAVIILNDNEMSISKSVGSFSKTLVSLSKSKLSRKIRRGLKIIFPKFLRRFTRKIKNSIKTLIQNNNIFEDLGFDYFGPIDGNDLKQCIKMFERIKRNNSPCVVHVLTKKGKGYKYAEEDKEGVFHGIGPFDIQNGKPISSQLDNELSYSQIVGNILLEKRDSQQFFIICPAMIVGMKLTKFQQKYPTDFYDVGIAEGHAATMAAGIALNKKDVVLFMYSTFAQRAYDQILNDICRPNLKVIIAIDRAGIVGEDGPTHQGIYDVAMFNHMPNIKVAMPMDAFECSMMFNYAFKQENPIVIRYPRASEVLKENYITDEVCELSWTILKEGSKGIIISYGPDLKRILKIVNDNNLDVKVVNARFIKPIDKKMLNKLFETKLPILVYEQVVTLGALTSSIYQHIISNNIKSPIIKNFGFNPDDIVVQGNIDKVLDVYGLGNDKILNEIKKLINE